MVRKAHARVQYCSDLVPSLSSIGSHAYFPDGRIPLRKVTIGSDIFPSCIVHTARPKKVGNTSTLYHPGCGLQVQTGAENLHRKPMRGFNFAATRSHVYFPEWKSALSGNRPPVSTRQSWVFSAYSGFLTHAGNVDRAGGLGLATVAVLRDEL